MQAIRRVAVIGGNRIPFARSNGRLRAGVQPGHAHRGAGRPGGRFGLAGERIGEVVAGAVLKHARTTTSTREVVLGSKLDPHTPAYDIQQACGTGLEAAILVANKIALGQIEAGIAGGTDTTSDAPLGAQRGPAPGPPRGQQCADVGRSAEGGHDAAVAAVQAGVRATRSRVPACRWGTTRRSPPPVGHRPRGPGRVGARLAPAARRRVRAGFFDDLVTPYLGLQRDQNLRPDTTWRSSAR